MCRPILWFLGTSYATRNGPLRLSSTARETVEYVPESHLRLRPHTSNSTLNPPSLAAMAGPTALPHISSRRRPPPTGDEEAGNTLKLGEMDSCQALSVAETNVLLHALDASRRNEGRQPCTKDIYVKARDYVGLFARFKDRQTVEQIERETTVSTHGIHQFERAQLGTSPSFSLTTL